MFPDEFLGSWALAAKNVLKSRPRAALSSDAGDHLALMQNSLLLLGDCKGLLAGGHRRWLLQLLEAGEIFNKQLLAVVVERIRTESPG